MKNSFFSRFTPKEPKFFPLLKQLSEVLVSSSAVLVESMQHDKPEERSSYYKKIKDLEREGDRLAHLIFDLSLHLTERIYRRWLLTWTMSSME